MNKPDSQVGSVGGEVWLLTIGLFWAAFKRESGSCLEAYVSGCAGNVGGLVRLYHLVGLREGRREEGVKVGPTRDRTLAFPSVPPSPAVTRHHRPPRLGSLRWFVAKALLISYNLTHVLGGHALTVRENVHSRHLRPGV